MIIKTRFAPSPTGYIHLGNARTAILNALACQGCSIRSADSEHKRRQPPTDEGVFMLRIEDTDGQRSQQHFIDGVCEDLQALNLSWHEGEQMGGDFAPYRQSQRLNIYQAYFDRLLALGYAYRCFCTPQDLANMRQGQKLSGLPPRYDGRCHRLDPAVIQQRYEDGVPSVLRFNTTFNHPPEAEVIFNDMIKGKQRFPRHEIGDFIIQKENGMPTFFFSNAVDDSLMGVTHVLRGDDHLTNTPRQMMLLQALSLTIPTYGHLSTVLGEDGTPLSKRNGSRSIRELMAEGWLPLAIVNYLARLGHYYASDQLLTIEQLRTQFNFSNLGKSATKFDWSLLSHWQRQALISMDAKALWQWMATQTPQIEAQVTAGHQHLFAQTIAANILLPHEASHYANLIYANDLPLTNEQQKMLSKKDKRLFALASTSYQQGNDFPTMTAQLKTQLGYQGKQLFQPLRIALTGESHGPEMAALLQLIPTALVIKRLRQWA